MRNTHKYIGLSKSFYQIPLEDSCKEKTAIAIQGRGLYQFKVMPFGLANAAQCMQSLVDSFFGVEFEGKVFCYIDDIIVISPTLWTKKPKITVFCRKSCKNITRFYEKHKFFGAHVKVLSTSSETCVKRAQTVRTYGFVTFPI